METLRPGMLFAATITTGVMAGRLHLGDRGHALRWILVSIALYGTTLVITFAVNGDLRGGVWLPGRRDTEQAMSLLLWIASHRVAEPVHAW